MLSYKTASIMLKHVKERENDLGDVIKRVLGIKFYFLFLMAAGLTLFLVSVVYFLFMANILYSIFNFFSF
jgi:amino acid permease